MSWEKIKNLVGDFTCMFGCEWFIETSEGNFIWSDPEYHGNNTICPFLGTYKDYLKSGDIPYGRDKGKHILKDYINPEPTFIDYINPESTYISGNS